MNDIRQLYTSCALCPMKCGMDRRAGKRGVCGEVDRMRIASACLHMGEEPVLTGDKGSGTVFFTGCTLGCGFCQNHQISREGVGKEVTVEELVGIFFVLQDQGAENINLVTGTHCIPHIILALARAREKGLIIPVLWNSSGYEEKESLTLLAPYVDIWVPDMKTLQSELSQKICGRKDYPEKAKEALLFMKGIKQTMIKHGIMKKGMIFRHLVLPGALESTKEVLSWYKENLIEDALLSIMFQFIPLEPSVGSDEQGDFPRFVSRGEYEEVLDYLDEIGIEDGFIQEPVHKREWIPDFTRENPFPRKCARPVWHYKKGFIR